MDLRGPLRREQQPQAVLAALGGDLDEPVQQPLRHRAGRLGAAQVVGLVDDEQRRDPAVALGPQLVDDLEADGDRLGRVAEPAEVHHRDAVATGDDVGGGRQVAGPHLPVEHPEVLHPLGQRLLAGGAGAQRREHLAHLRVRADLRQEADEGVVLVLVAHRVQLQGGGLGLAGHRAEPHPQRFVALGARGVAAQHPHAALGDPLGVGLRHPRDRRAEVDEVGVRVEDGHPQVGLQQEPLEEHPEGVRLARPALAAEEGVPVEPAGPQARLGADVTGAPGADRQGAGGRAVQAAELGGPGEVHGGLAERRPVAALHRARLVQGADDDTEPGQRLVAGRLHDVDDLAQEPDPLGGGDDDHVTRRHRVGRVGVEREAPPVAGLGRCLTRRHRVLLSRPTGRDGRVVVVPRTSWRMPCHAAAPPDGLGPPRDR